MIDPSFKRATIQSFFWKFVERAGNQIIMLAVQIVMARLLSPNEFGMLAIMIVFINVGNVVVQSGLNTGLIQIGKIRRGDYSTVFWMSFGISLVLYALIFFAAPSIAAFFAVPEIVWPLRVLTLNLIINSYTAIQVAKVARAMDFKKVFVATIWAAAISGGLGVAVALLGGGLWALVAQQLSYQFVNALVPSAQVPWLPHLVFRPKRAAILFRFGWKLLVSGLLDTGYQSLSDMIIGKRFSSVDLGQVSQGNKYPQALGVSIDSAIQPVLLAAVSRLQDDVDKVRQVVRRSLMTSTYVVFPAMALLAVTAEPIVRMLLGEQWLPAVVFMQLYCFLYALWPIHTTNLQALNGMGRSDIFLRLEIIKKFLGLPVLLFTAFVIGDIYAIVIGTLIADVIETYINATSSKKVFRYGYLRQVRDIAPAFIVAMVSAALVYPLGLLDLPDAVLIAAQATLFVTSYVGLSRLFRIEAFTYLFSTLKSYRSERQPATIPLNEGA